tara:strand:- start:1408 stop:2448 length:1041 start_codon:yes stop_codon:yes gene_type:complete
MKKNILIVGHKGYVGSILINYLSNLKNYKNSLFGIDTNWFSLNNYVNKQKKTALDINSDSRKINLNKLSSKPDVIIYLAAVSNDPMGKRFKIATEDINFKNCIKLAKQAKKIKVEKFIFASSCSMYGSSGSSLKKETDKLQPLTDYAKSKVNSEKKLRQISSKKFKIISLRFATAAGMSDNLRLDLVFNDFIANATLKKEIELLSSGSSWRPLIHVQDMAKAFHWAIEYKIKKNFLAINIGSEKWNFKIIDLAKKIANIIGGVNIRINESNIDKRSYRVDFRLFKKIAPKYQPSVKFKTAVKKLEIFFKREKRTLKDFRNSPKWSRLMRLNHLIKNRKINKKLYWI